MTDIYHIQISVYVRDITKYGARAAANISKHAIEDSLPTGNLDEVVIDAVGIENSNIPADMRSMAISDITEQPQNR